MLSNNPTKTRGIEKAWRKEVTNRLNKFTLSMLSELTNVMFVTNAFDLSASQVQIYLEFLRRELDSMVLGTWQHEYQQRAYNLSLQHFSNELSTKGLTPEQIKAVEGLTTTFTATSTLGLGASVYPIHRDTLAFLFSRSFESMKGVTDKMAREISQILFDGVEQGYSIKKVAKMLRERVGVAKTRSFLIAQTEIIQAYHRGKINQAELYSDILGEDIRLRWLTRKDERVRPLHVSFHGRIYSQKQARINISISPWRCRCGLTPIIKESDTEKAKIKFDKERKHLQTLQKP